MEQPKEIERTADGGSSAATGSPRRGFREQYIECRQAGMVKEGQFLSFEDHPEMLPAIPTPKMVAAIKSGEWKGIQLSECGRFGGRCNSGNPGCQKLRGLENTA